MTTDSILVIAAHPDDEALGCGATLARHAAEGARVTVLFLADGETARADADPARLEKRRAMARAACAELGAAEVVFLDFPDNRLDTVALLGIVQEIEAVADRVAPTVVYTHHGGDLNVDHRIANQATMTAFRPLPGATVRAIRAFEVMSSTEWATASSGPAFRPNLFVDVSGHYGAKRRALDIYGPEMRAYPHARSMEAVEALARYRGASAGMDLAEAFVVERELR